MLHVPTDNENIRQRRAANFGHRRLLVPVLNYVMDKNFQTKQDFFNNFLIALKIFLERAAAPATVPGLRPESYVLKEQSVVVVVDMVVR